MRSATAIVLVLILAGIAMPGQSQGAAPSLTSVTTLDQHDDSTLRANGRIDTIVLAWSADLDETTLHLTDFAVAGYEIIGYKMATLRVVHLRIQEGAHDTDAKPAVTFAAGRLAGTTGTLAAATVPATLDGAAPVLTMVRAAAGSTGVTLRFSEGVTALGDGSLTYNNRAAGGATSFVPGSISHTASEKVATLTLDVAAAAADLAASGDTIAVASSVKDAAGNSASTQERNLRAPQVTQVRANVGSDLVTLRFNAPVASVTSFAASDFDVVYFSTPPTPIAGVAAFVSATTFDVTLKLTSAVQASDVRSLEPAHVQIVGDRVTVGGQTLSATSAAMTDVTPPRLLQAYTADRNRNGYLDAMILEWSEPVDAICTDGIDVASPYEEDIDASRLPIVMPNGTQVIVPLVERSSQAPDTGAVPSFTSFQCTSGSKPFADRADPPSQAIDVGHATVLEQDRAKPVIVTGTTADTDGDGRIDGYTLDFSEPMSAVTFDPREWVVPGHNITTDAVWATEFKFLLTFEQSELGDSGELPDLTYTGNTMKDTAGNPLLHFEGGGFERVDGANPVIIDAFGDAGSKVLYLVFSEGVEGVTDPNNPSSPGRGILERDFAFQNAGGGNIGILDVVHNKGDKIAKLLTASPLEDVDFGPSGDKVMVLQNHVRESNEKAAAARGPVPSALVAFGERDITPPGTVIDPTVVPGVNDLTLRFTAPADDAGDPNSGAPTQYRIHVANATFDVDATEFMALPAWPDIELDQVDPEAPDQGLPVAPGETQLIKIGSLCPSTRYFVGFVALDEDGNPSGVVRPAAAATLKDPTLPEGTLSFLSVTHPVNETGVPVPTHLRNGTVAWTGISDAEACELTSYWAIDQDATRAVTADDNATLAAGTDFTLNRSIRAPANIWLHVAVASDGGITQTFHHPMQLVPPAECSAANVHAKSVVVRDGRFTDITWKPVDPVLPDDIFVIGYQIWLQMAPGDNWQMRAFLETPDELRFIDEADIDEDSRYIINGVLTGDVCRFATDGDGMLVATLNEDGEKATAFDEFSSDPVTIIAPPPRVPTWAWVTLTALALILIAGVALFYGLRRSRMDDGWIEDEEEEDHSDPFGSDPIDDLGAEDAGSDDPFAVAQGNAAPAGDAPTIDISCPACSHLFQATGHRPLSITCPNCHASGVLE